MAALCIAATTAAAQSQWTQLAPNSPVSSIINHGLAYDASRDRVVRYGGSSCDGSRGTWEWDGERWEQRSPVASPPSRQGLAMVYDPYRKRTVMFGGYSLRFVLLDDLWEWDGVTWTERPTSVRPPARMFHAMAYDQARRCIVLFGGFTGSGVVVLDDTWTWDGSAWQEHQPATHPPPLFAAAMAYDPVRERCVLFGGGDDSFSYRDETWEWDGSTWTLWQPVTRPAARSSPGLAYDHQRRQVVLFGGLSSTGRLADTWGWDGQQWTLLASAGPPGRGYLGMVYDSRRGRLLIHGGGYTGVFATYCMNDTWALEPVIPGYSGFGSGCPGPLGIPQLALLTGEGTLGLQLTGLATTPHPVVFLLGSSRQQWGTLSLPYTLAGLGPPQCALWVQPQIAVPVSASAGTATLTFPAGSAELLGSVHAQGVALNTTAGTTTISMSGAATITPRLLVR